MSKNTIGTPEEQAIHKEAVRLRKMTDQQLVTAFREKPQAPECGRDNLRLLIKLLTDGECKGVKGGIVYRITEFAKEKGLLR